MLASMSCSRGLMDNVLASGVEVVGLSLTMINFCVSIICNCIKAEMTENVVEIHDAGPWSGASYSRDEDHTES